MYTRIRRVLTGRCIARSRLAPWRFQSMVYIFHKLGKFYGAIMLKAQALTANEAAAASRIPLKQVHRIIDAGLLEGAVETRRGNRLINGLGLVALKLAYVTADVLTPAARRRAVLSVLKEIGRAHV